MGTGASKTASRALDVTFNQGAKLCPYGQSATTFAVLRHIALNLYVMR
jgi:hypothetical protein